MAKKGERAQKLKAFFGINPSVLTMLLMAILLGLGEKMGERESGDGSMIVSI